ncbi:MAG TPA: 1-acyl-sn-glycerol-3-phosphate acyltransferase [Magnetococcales bacterium]|nr:1-acyl-sn-glycerol-3-phosphate acyltransferase [Magnetococcales bacterium]
MFWILQGGAMLTNIRAFVGSGMFFLLLVVGILFFTLWIVSVWPFSSLLYRREVARSWADYNRRVLSWTCGLVENQQGLEHLPPPPYLLFVKHQSAWETVTLHALFPVFVLVLKKSLLHIPVFGWALRATGQIAIDRSLGVQSMHMMHDRGLEEFRRGVSVVVFPEGTRVAPGEVGKYNAGGIALAIEAGVPIVPVAHNAGSFWRRRAFLKKAGVIQVRIGPSIATLGCDKKDRKRLLEEAKNSVESMMAAIYAERPDLRDG